MPPIIVARARRDTPAASKVLHFNNAGAALPPQHVTDTVVNHLRLESEIGAYEAAHHAEQRCNAVYSSVASLLNAQRSEIALTQGADTAWAAAFNAIAFRPGDRILTSMVEYNSSYLGFMNMRDRVGIEVTPVPDDNTGQLDVDALRAMLDERVKLIAVAHVPSNGGLVNPVEAIGAVARRNEILYLVDACQSIGQLPVDVEAIGCDFLSFTGRKFLRGPRGTGGLYVRSGVLDQLTPWTVDGRSAVWTSHDTYEYSPGALRFESFEHSVAARLGLGAAADYAQLWGLDAIETRIVKAADNLREQLSEMGGVTVHDKGARKCGIVTFSIAGLEAEQVKSALSAERVNVWTTDRASTLLDMEARRLDSIVRASLHYYNSDDEIDRFCGLVARLTQR